jgi:hypothetical protein
MRREVKRFSIVRWVDDNDRIDMIPISWSFNACNKNKHLIWELSGYFPIFWFTKLIRKTLVQYRICKKSLKIPKEKGQTTIYKTLPYDHDGPHWHFIFTSALLLWDWKNTDSLFWHLGQGWSSVRGSVGSAITSPIIWVNSL